MSVHIVQGNCRHSANWPDGKARLVFADPPFNIGRPYEEWVDRLEFDAYHALTMTWLRHAHRTLGENGSLFINIPDNLVHMFLSLADHCGFYRYDWLIWHYRFGQHNEYRFTDSHTHCLWFCKKGDTPLWNPNEIRVPSERQKQGDKRANAKGRIPMDVWYGDGWGRVQGNNRERVPGQDNQLPERYLDRVIRCCTREGDLVVDPFLGSGTTAVVAEALRRHCHGIEIGEEAVRRAWRRVENGSVLYEGTALSDVDE